MILLEFFRTSILKIVYKNNNEKRYTVTLPMFWDENKVDSLDREFDWMLNIKFCGNI